MELEKDFLLYSEKIKKVKNVSDEDKLFLYAYFKQATIGDCNINKPNAFDLVGNAKYNAWKEVEGTNKLISMKYYVKKVKSLL